MPEATDDRIHQPARTALFPEAPQLLGALVDAGALAASWSGAGPSLIGMVRAEAAASVLAGAEAALVAGGRAGPRAWCSQPTAAASSTETRPTVPLCSGITCRASPPAW